MLAMLRTPRWIGLTALALVFLIAFGALSWWQWQRAQRDREERAPVAASSVLTATAPLASGDYGIRVTVTGTYDAANQVLVQHGPSSFWVVTPLRPADGTAVAVARGTIASATDPAARAVPGGTVTVVGVAQPYEGDPGTTSNLPTGTVERLVATAFDTDYPLALGWIALASQDPPDTTGLGPVVAPISAESSSSVRLQNATYAVEWFLFAGFVVFFWVRMLRDDLRGLTTAPTPEPSAPVRDVY